MNIYSQYSLIGDLSLEQLVSGSNDPDQSMPDDETVKRPIVVMSRQHGTQFVTLEQIFAQWA